MQEKTYRLQNPQAVPSPALIFYRDILLENTKKVIAMAGGAERLWPHVKTHKCQEMVKLQLAQGIRRFKCATFAEAEMTAQCGPDAILLAYPLVGPNIERFMQLVQAYSSVAFFAIGDDLVQLQLLSQAALRRGTKVRVLIDVNIGMNRTGVPVERADDFFRQASKLAGLLIQGLHCYDGQRGEEVSLRTQRVDESVAPIHQLQKAWQRDGLDCSVLVMGGSPSFPCHAAYEGAYLSPGTLFVMDAGYHKKFPDLSYEPGAALLTRVVSHPNEGLFTLDLGYKGIASDPEGVRGVLVGMENAESLFQSEEHWTFRMKAGQEGQRPPIGTVLYVIPTHICPTVALYPSLLVVQEGQVVDTWEVAARNRRLSI